MILKNKVSILFLSMIMSFRILGLFMILPVFSAHALSIFGATPTLIGVALGIYGLTQAILQTPFGLLSDHIGRKPTIAIGLVLFAIGSIVAAMSGNMTQLIIGRALQGTGAIGSATLALVSDITRDENRSKAMAFIGLSIGITFSIAIITGPIFFAWYKLSGIFWITAGFAVLGLLLLTQVPKPPEIIVQTNVELAPNKLKTALKNKQLLRLDFGIFSLHLILTAFFIVIPILFTHVFLWSIWKQASTYLVVLLLSFVLTFPFIIIAEKKRKMKTIFISAITVLCITQILLYFVSDYGRVIGLVLLLFFVAFNLLEASLPSLVSKFASIKMRGTAMGLYSTSQYLGIALGGGLGGYILAHFGLHGVFIFCGFFAFLWWLASITMLPPPYLSTLIFEVPSKGFEISQKVSKIFGVAEVLYSEKEKLVYAKVDKKEISENELRKCIEEVTLA